MYNVTPELIESLRTDIEEIIARLCCCSRVGGLLRLPRLSLEGSEVVGLKQGRRIRTTVDVEIRLVRYHNQHEGH